MNWHWQKAASAMGKHQVRRNMVHASCWTEIYGVKEGNKGTSRLLSGEEHGPVLHYLGLGSYFKVWTCKPNSRAVTTSQPNSHSKPNAPAWNRFYYYSYVTFSFIKLPWIYFKLFFFLDRLAFSSITVILKIDLFYWYSGHLLVY